MHISCMRYLLNTNVLYYNAGIPTILVEQIALTIVFVSTSSASFTIFSLIDRAIIDWPFYAVWLLLLRWGSCKKLPHPHGAYTIHLAVSTCSPTYWPFLMCYVIHLFFQILVHLLVFSIFSGTAFTFTLEAIFPPIYLEGKSSFLPFLAFPKDVQIRKNWSVGYLGLKLQCL